MRGHGAVLLIGFLILYRVLMTRLCQVVPYQDGEKSEEVVGWDMGNGGEVL